MRFRVGVVLCLLLAWFGVGCRKALAPSADNNQPPETWITAAPQDTITTRDSDGFPVAPTVGVIPFKFHVYWAGSDQDGAVAGFYYAVVETLPLPQEGFALPPSLPGPKPRDYHFTTRTDTSLIFRVSEDTPVREHAFFVYSVDNKGKADATPARFIFRAIDNYPPLGVIDIARATGPVYQLLPGGGLTSVTQTFQIRDSFNVNTLPSDTVPAYSQLYFQWHGEPRILGGFVANFRYKLDEIAFNTVDSSVHSVSYNTGVNGDIVPPGPKLFTLRTVGLSGWRSEVTRRFVMNFSPDTWYSGPDRTDPAQAWQSFQDGNGKRYYYKDVNFTGFTGIPNTMLSLDSANVLPALRPNRRTFFEIYQNRVWYHEEGDTVHMNSWVVFPTGGFDRDSPYLVTSDTRDPLRPPGVVATPDPNPNGSPKGFRSRLVTKTDLGSVIEPTQSTTYPLFDPASVFRAPYISAYWGTVYSGKGYMLVRAEDGDKGIDGRVTRAMALADRVDSLNGTPYENILRKQIMTFYINRSPYLLRSDPLFRPIANSTLTSRTVNLVLIADDPDPFDPGNRPPVGGPSSTKVLRRHITLLGKNAAGRDTSFVDNTDYFNTNITSYQIPIFIVNGPMTFRIQLCDCPTCELFPGQGRCIVTDIPVTLAAPAPAEATSPSSTSSLTGPTPLTPSTGRRAP